MEPFSENLKKLKFIAMIKPNEKIDTRNLVSEPITLLNSISRFFSGETRVQTILFLSQTIERTFEIIDITKNDRPTDAKMFIFDLQQAVHGLNAVKQTYFESNDRIFACEISNLIQKVECKITNLKDVNSVLFI